MISAQPPVTAPYDGKDPTGFDLDQLKLERRIPEPQYPGFGIPSGGADIGPTTSGFPEMILSIKKSRRPKAPTRRRRTT